MSKMTDLYTHQAAFSVFFGSWVFLQIKASSFELDFKYFVVYSKSSSRSQNLHICMARVHEQN